MAHDSAAATQTIALTEVLGLMAADPLAKSLAGQRGRKVVIDASQVQHLGAQCLQVLLSAAATWGAEGASLRVVNRSAAFASCLDLVGIPAATFAE